MALSSRRCRWKTLQGAMALLSLATASAYASTGIAANSASVVEEANKPLPVSGGTIVGYMRMEPNRKANPAALFATLPVNHPFARLCVSLMARDLRYSAAMWYPVAGIHGEVALSYTSKYPALVTSFSSEELAISAKLGNDCPTANRLVAAGWGPPTGAEKAVLYLNLGTTEAFVDMTAPAGGAHTVQCLRIKAQPLRSFDHQCSLGDATPTRIRRRSLGDWLDEINLVP